MGTQLQNAQTLGLQLEKVRDKVPLWYQRDSTLFDMIKKRGDVEVVSTRNMRIPIQVSPGGNFRQVNADGGDFGRGSGTSYDVAQVTPVYFAQATEISKLAEVATNSDQKAVENVAKKEVQNAIDQVRTNLEALLNTDGSASLGTVTAISGTTLTVPNANAFSINQIVQDWSALGGTNRGSFTVTSVDANAKTITISAAPTGLAVGDVLLLDGASGTAGTSLFGVPYHQVYSDTGTWLGLSRATYPVQLNTPEVVAGNTALTPQMVRQALNYLRRRLGADTPELDGLTWHANVDVEAAWEDAGLLVSEIFLNQVKGDNSYDMLKKSGPKTISGRPLVTSIHAAPGRLDGLCLDHWGRAESQPIDYLEYGGQTIFPLYGASGGVAGASCFYFWTGMQIFTDNPQAGCMVTGLTIPSGY